MISERPAEVEDRAVPGHWEGDLIIGLNKSAIGTLVERTTRFTMLLHLPPMDGHGTISRESRTARRSPVTAPKLFVTPSPPRSGLCPSNYAARSHGTKEPRWPSTRSCVSTPDWLSTSADPHSPWQRGTNENTNGLLRQYFPKGTDLSKHHPDDLVAVAAALNGRPRKTLSWKTPAEALDRLLKSVGQGSVATTS